MFERLKARSHVLRGLAACFVVFAAGVASAQTLTTADTGRFTGADRTQRLIAGAKKEGALTVYSSAQVAVMTAIGNAFERKYGVKFTLWRGSSEQIVQRVQAEARANRLVADAVETAGPSMEAMSRQQVLQEIATPVTAELMPEASAPGRPWIVSRLSVFTLAYNTSRVRKADVPTSYEGLLDPKWKGRLGIEADDNNWLMTATAALGEERGLKLMRDIVAKNGISVWKGHSLMANQVVSGEVPVALTAYVDEIETLKKTGAPVDYAFATPTVAMPTAVGVFKRAPHPHAAMLFADFVLSEEGQTILAAHGMVTTNLKVQRLPEGTKLVFMDVGRYLDESAKWARLYRETFVTNAR